MENKDIKGLSDADLLDKIREEKAALSKLKLNHNISPIENPLTIRHALLVVARKVFSAK